MTLAPGPRLGAYEVLALIGAGGMGEVYRASDTKLNRDVALKLLPDALLFLHFRETTTCGEKRPLPSVATRKAAFLMFKLSSDGRYLAFVDTGGGQSRLWVRALDAVEAKVIPGPNVIDQKEKEWGLVN